MIKLNNILFTKCDLTKLKAKNKYDLVYSIDVLEHIPKEREVEYFSRIYSLLEEKGMVIAGINPERNLVEIIELKNHPYFVATQFHPEFKSRPLRPHPLFKGFIRACIE